MPNVNNTRTTFKTSAVLALILSAALLTGCATANMQPPKPSDAPLYTLDTVAVDTSSHIRELSAIKAARLQKEASQEQWRAFMFNLQSVPEALSKRETFTFVGTSADGLKGIADLAGYRFAVIGKSPSQPLMVSLDANNQMLIDSLRDVNAQINGKADVMISPKAKLISLTYRVKV